MTDTSLGRPKHLYRTLSSSFERQCAARMPYACTGASSEGKRWAAAQEMASPEDGARSEAGTPTPNSKTPGAAPGAAPAVAPAPETDQWVQCDRCRTWRVVPAQHWPSVEADTREVSAAPRTAARSGELGDPQCYCAFLFCRARKA